MEDSKSTQDVPTVLERAMPRLFAYLRRYWWLVLYVVYATIGLLVLADWLTPRHLDDAIDVSRPRWSPDGKYLLVGCAFDYYDEYPDFETCVTTTDLSIVKRVRDRDFRTQVSAAVWSSPSGFAFGTLEELILMDLTKSDSQVIPLSSGCDEPVWSPGGQHIACMSNSHEIIVVEIPSGRVMVQTHSGDNYNPRWTERGVIYEHVTDWSESSYYDLMMIDPITSVEQPLVQLLRGYQQAEVAPDNSRLAYVSVDGNDLLVADLPLKDAKDILVPYETCLEDIGFLTWSPDSRYVTFTAKENYRSPEQIYVLTTVHKNRGEN